MCLHIPCKVNQIKPFGEIYNQKKRKNSLFLPCGGRKTALSPHFRRLAVAFPPPRRRKTNAVVLKNERSRFEKRTRSFSKKRALVFQKEGAFAKAKGRRWRDFAGERGRKHKKKA